MEKIEFTNPESKEHNEEVRNYLELMRDTESLIGDGMEKLKGANWAKLWSSLDKLVFYPKTYEGNLAIFKTRCNIRYVSLFTKPAFCCDQEADFELGGILRSWLNDGQKRGYSLLINTTINEYWGHGIFIDPDTGHIAPVMTDYDAEHRTYTLY